MLRLRRVTARTDHYHSQLGDDADEREREFYHTGLNLASYRRPANAPAHFIPAVPFGFEYLDVARLREINFGRQDTLGPQMVINAEERPADGYKVCRDCGLVVAPQQDLTGQNGSPHGAGAPWGEPFFRQEWAQVVQTHGVTSRADYLRVARTGRGVRLTRKERLRVWEVFEEYQRNLKELGKVEWLDLIRQTRQYLAHKGNILPYRAVIVDETQDLHPEELKLIRQIVPAGDNDIFLVGDAHQRIYGRPVVLSQCGINVVGRSRKLKINYRTTEEIKNWAVAVLRDQPIDDLDGGADTHQSGYRSLLTGVPPEVHNFPLLADEKAFLIEKLRRLTAEVSAETVCLVARTHHQLVEDYLPALEQAGIAHLCYESPRRLVQS